VVAVVLALAVAACGGGVPGDSVARVDNTNITKAQFAHWLAVAAKSQGSTTGGAAVVPDPPNYTSCVAAKRKAQPKTARGQKPPTDAQLRTQCQQLYNALRDQVLQFLVSANWILGEAKAQNVSVTDAEVQKQFDQTRKQSFPKLADYQRFLKQSGMTQDDILLRVRLDALSTKLRNKVTKGKDAVTQAQIAAYYNANRQQFGQPERRNMRIVLTKNKAQAEQALAALQSGQSWNAVAKTYSIDPQSKSRGGLLQGITKGTQDQALDSAAFGASAKKGKLVGPVKGQFGWYLVEVQSISKPTQQSLAQATPTIRSTLVAQNQQKALQDFVTDFRKRWRGKTDCRSGYVIADCKNAPKPKTTSSGQSSPGQATTGASTSTSP
jgi:foldase protein PrsA